MALGTSFLIIPELRVLVLTKRHVDSGNEIAAGCNRRTCAVSHFSENLLLAAVSAPAVAICLNSLISRTTLSYSANCSIFRAKEIGHKKYYEETRELEK